ncbi:unnamed protein product [Blepharisma stoltei]|uniref:Uncharacterized protein n=1 Tax=Blepharisma stoltei TaxID=1481888 RepID=A0AAU9IPS4_9CILI|nr:unnamed protein product [Blepharisma stoltei]
MDSQAVTWFVFCVISGFAFYFVGKYAQSKKAMLLKPPSSSQENDEEEPSVNLKSKNSLSYKKELLREKETKRRMVEEYEHEIAYLKSALSEAKKNSSERIKRQEEDKALMKEIHQEVGPIVQVVEGTDFISGEKLDEEIDKELNMDI